MLQFCLRGQLIAANPPACEWDSPAQHPAGCQHIPVCPTNSSGKGETVGPLAVFIQLEHLCIRSVLVLEWQQMIWLASWWRQQNCLEAVLGYPHNQLTGITSSAKLQCPKIWVFPPSPWSQVQAAGIQTPEGWHLPADCLGSKPSALPHWQVCLPTFAP